MLFLHICSNSIVKVPFSYILTTFVDKYIHYIVKVWKQ